MLTQEDDVDIHALRRRGWSISAFARHVGRDRKTVRVYLEGKRQVGQRAPAGEDSFARFVDYAAARLAEDPHLWSTALHDEVVSSVMSGRIRRSPGRCGCGVCGRHASRATRRQAARRR